VEVVDVEEEIHHCSLAERVVVESLLFVLPVYIYDKNNNDKK
jgi:hypothetical protein